MSEGCATVSDFPRRFFSKLKEALGLIFRYPEMKLADVNYDDYWRSKRADFMGTLTEFQRTRCDIMASVIEDNSTILDLGCGDGGVLLYLMKHKKLQAVGVDSSQVALDYVASHGIETIKLDLSNISSLKSLPNVDYIIACEILEHLPNSERCLLTLLEKAGKGVIFSIPNSGYFPYRIRLMLGKTIMQWRLHPGEHLRFWTIADLKWWLKSLGLLKNSNIFCYEGIPLLNRIFPSIFSMGLIANISLPISNSSQEALS